LAKAGVPCFYESEVLNSSFMHLMKFSAKKYPPSQSGLTLGKSSRRNRYFDNIPKNGIFEANI